MEVQKQVFVNFLTEIEILLDARHGCGATGRITNLPPSAKWIKMGCLAGLNVFALKKIWCCLVIKNASIFIGLLITICVLRYALFNGMRRLAVFLFYLVRNHVLGGY